MSLPEYPQNRGEQYLAKIAGQDVDTPEEPQSRVEQYLDYIADHGTVNPETVAEKVADWMEDNITEDPTVVIDKSLLIEGAAADAKAVGEALDTVVARFQ